MMEKNPNSKLKEGLVEGLKLAMSHGESLQQAMQSFYNAGYKKGDIESAAREVQMQKTNYQEMQPATQTYSKPYQNKQRPQPQKQKYETYQKPSKTENIQKVSSYEQKQKSSKKLIIALSVLLIILLGVLASLFFFGEEIKLFFNGLFS